jgi:hypothetical protein
MKVNKKGILRFLGVIFIFTTFSSKGEPLRFPDSFPIPMTFRASDGATLGSDEFTRRFNKLEPYPFIHELGFNKKVNVISEKWPNKVITIQDAYGGIRGEYFSEVWPGHLLYKTGTLITQNISAQDTVIQVDDISRIAKNRKRVKKINTNSPFVLVIYALDDSGKPNWGHAEHIVLEDIKGDKLIVKRGQWKSAAQSFQGKKAVIATQMMFWTKQWQLNFSLHCPRGGPDNLTAAEWFARKMSQRVRETEADGIEFDVGRWVFGQPQENPMDANNDLVTDYGYIEGINSFGLGGQVFFRELRKALGPDKIIQADSNDAIGGVRGWKYINGVQMEAFPASNDFDSFSEAFLHLRLWSENAEALPRFSYPLTKTATTVFENVRLPNGKATDFRFRTGLAAAAMVGMPHPFVSFNFAFDPDDADLASKEQRNESKLAIGIFTWDEYHGGDLNNWHWLGKPKAAAIQDLSDLDKDDKLAKANWQWFVENGFSAKHEQSASKFSATVQETPNGIIPKKRWTGVRLALKNGGLTTLKPDQEYTIEFEARGDDSWHYVNQTFEHVPRMITIGGAIKNDLKNRPISVLVGSEWRNYRISFIADSSHAATPVFGVSEQIGTTELRNIKFHEGGVERWSREFENGLVLLNMTNNPWRVAVQKNYYRRLKGAQVPDVNNGQPIENEVTVPPRDAVFLTKR